jgi:uncharacterized protein YbjT (DUF2867 family)
MRIGILGGTGRTGRRAVIHALGAGHELRLLVRGEVQGIPDVVEVVRGDGLDPAVVDRFVEGLDAVIVALGPGPRSPPDVCSRATDLVVRAMRAHGVERLVVLTGAMVGHGKLGPAYRRLARRPRVQAVLDERREQERIVRESGLLWTIVRPPRLTDGAPRGRLEVGPEAPIGLLDGVTRDEVAQTLVVALDGRWAGAGVAVVGRLGAARPGRILAAWIVAMGLAEFLGIAAVAAVAVAWFGRLGEPGTTAAAWGFLAAMVAAGAFEGALLGLWPGRVAAEVLLAIDRRSFLRNTVIVAAIAWFLGMLPSTLMDSSGSGDWEAPPPWLLGAGIAGFGLLGGALIGAAQWLAMRRVRGAGWWIPATALGWGLGLPLDFAGVSLVPAGAPLPVAVAIAGGFGLLAGVVVALPTGICLLRLVRRCH